MPHRFTTISPPAHCASAILKLAFNGKLASKIIPTYFVIARNLLLLKIIVDPNPNGSNDFQRFTPNWGGVNKSLKICFAEFSGNQYFIQKHLKRR